MHPGIARESQRSCPRAPSGPSPGLQGTSAAPASSYGLKPARPVPPTACAKRRRKCRNLARAQAQAMFRPSCPSWTACSQLCTARFRFSGGLAALRILAHQPCGIPDSSKPERKSASSETITSAPASEYCGVAPLASAVPAMAGSYCTSVALRIGLLNGLPLPRQRRRRYGPAQEVKSRAVLRIPLPHGEAYRQNRSIASLRLGSWFLIERSGS